jgi:hypothetical protein
VVAYLRATVPSIIDQARADWGLDGQQLPYPEGYEAYEPYALDKWPLLGVNVTNAGLFRRQSYEDVTAQEYMSQYSIQVFTWVRTPTDSTGSPIEPEYSEALRVRDDLAACVRAALLKSGSLGQPGAILFDESSMSENYSEATAVKGERFVAGVVHAFDIRFDESVPLVGIGTADIISISGQTIAETIQEELETP